MVANDSGFRLRRIALRVAVPERAGPPDIYPVVSILIDTEEILPGADHCGYAGSPPAAILAEDEPLLPAEAPRRIAVCGIPSCGYIAPVISRAGGLVVWSDFWAGIDVDDPPYIRPEEIRGGRRLDFPDLMFDAGQYTTQVRHVSAQREWESGPWRTALLTDQLLSANPWTLGDPRLTRFCELGSVQPDPTEPDSFCVTIWDINLQAAIVVSLRPRPGTPEEQASQMAGYLASAPADQWPVIEQIHQQPDS
jgi:hypothetical protein